jgi:hypothetical protein
VSWRSLLEALGTPGQDEHEQALAALYNRAKCLTRTLSQSPEFWLQDSPQIAVC